MTAPAMTASGIPATPRRRFKWRRAGLHAFLITVSALWLFPLAWAMFTAFRPYADTQQNGYVPKFEWWFTSFPGVLSVDNFTRAWNNAEIPHYYITTLVVTVPAVILTLFIASMVAFGLTRFSGRFNLIGLMLFTAGNLLPPQVIIVPLFRLFNAIPVPHLFSFGVGDVDVAVFSDGGLLYDQFAGVILINVVFQMGFCIFVLSNYMRTISKELVEAAVVDGAGVWTIYRRVILPLCRPALAALATLEFTFIYNDFFWALLLMKSGARRPITAALNNLQGAFFADNNLLAAGSLLVAIPTIVVFLVLQRHFVGGLSLGATKG